MTLSNPCLSSNRRRARTPIRVEPLEERRLLTAALSGQFFTNTLSIGQQATYEFTAKVGERAFGIVTEQTINSNSGDLSTPGLRLIDPDGVQLDLDTGYTGVEMFSGVLTKNGTYQFVVYDANNDSALSYGFTLNAGSTPVVSGDNKSGPIDSGRYVTNTLAAGEANVYTVRSRAGGSILALHAEQTLNSNSGDPSTPAMAVFSPSGARLEFDTGYTGETLLAQNLPEDGVYRIVVWDSGVNSALVSGLTVVAAPALAQVDDGNNNGLLSDGVSRTSVIAAGEANVYAFAGEAGKTLTLTAAEVTPDSNSGDPSTPGLVVFSPDGTVLHNDAGYVSDTYTATSLPLSGQYLAVVFDSGTNSALNYTVSRTGGGAPFAQVDYFSDTLRIEGGGANDIIQASQRDAVLAGVATKELVITKADKTVTFYIDDVVRTEAFLGAGNDAFVATADFSVDTYVFGDTGDDTIYTGAGDDTITGGAGRNRMLGQNGSDRINGSGGRDFLRGGLGDDRLYGMAGNDDIAGDAGVDRLYGGDGDDFLKGGGSNDKLYGDAGNDTLAGEGQRDLLVGGDGDDLFGAREGLADTLEGGLGNDTAAIDSIDSVLAIESFV